MDFSQKTANANDWFLCLPTPPGSAAGVGPLEVDSPTTYHLRTCWRRHGSHTTSSVEQAVVYSTLPQEYSTLTFRGEVLQMVEEWKRGAK